jgi:uncharacterized protein YbbC (DUF1343 family)
MTHNKTIKHIKALVLAAVLLSACGCHGAVRTGLDNVRSYGHLFAGKRVGIVTNHTAYDSSGEHIVDVFMSMPGVKVTALFGPEHGVYGLADAGEKVVDHRHDRLDIPVYSLYGKIRKPTAEMLSKVDVLVFDIQDIGARFYTYIYTMAYAMEAAAEQGKAFVVLDRPNPITGVRVEGNILEKEFTSFVGMFPMPVTHGMTVGELARMFNGERWLKGHVQANLTVIPMTRWKRSMWYDETGLKFIKPSPNMPDIETAIIYPGLCLLEGTNVSEGRGTDKPFLQFGAPWVESNGLAANLNSLNLPGIYFKPTSFTPTSSKHKGLLCRGAEIIITDRDAIRPYFTGIKIVETLGRMYHEEFQWRQSSFERLSGTASIRNAIIEGKSVKTIEAGWRRDLNSFVRMRRKYLLYRMN